MGPSNARKRPWLAAVLAVIVTGLGHLYLGRWRRALGWLVAVFAVSTLFVDPAALEALASGDAVDPIEVAPTLLVGSLNVVDAYFVARAQNAGAPAAAVANREGMAGDAGRCPNCGKELDADLDFCQWCSTSLQEVETARTDR